MTVLPEHAVDWRFFFDVSRTSAQTAKRIEATLNTQLLHLPVSAVPGARQGALAQPVTSLAVRNLLRSKTLGLPSGQDVARAIGEIPLTDEELGTTRPVYLWYYILKEAEVRSLGPVGSRIVAEVLIGLLDADPSSYRSVFPRWRPTTGGDAGTVRGRGSVERSWGCQQLTDDHGHSRRLPGAGSYCPSSG
ncbi:hypothetical protein [Streptomyces sp. NPDC000888]